MRNIHPGEILRDEVINTHAITVTEAARLLGVTRTTLSNVLNQKADISAEMCFRIAIVFGGTPEIWANLQSKYSLAMVQEKVKQYKLTPYQPGKTA
ncbi:MAG: HigA family addiction module antitoxin [Bacteroidota bacterium]